MVSRFVMTIADTWIYLCQLCAYLRLLFYIRIAKCLRQDSQKPAMMAYAEFINGDIINVTNDLSIYYVADKILSVASAQRWLTKVHDREPNKLTLLVTLVNPLAFRHSVIDLNNDVELLTDECVDDMLQIPGKIYN